MEEDDLDLLEENTGASFKHRLTRLRRAPGSPSARSSGKRKAVVESSDDDLDNDDLELPKVQDIHNIWDDERGGGRDDEDDAEEEEHSNQLRCLALHVLAGTLIAQQKHSEVIAVNIPVLVETQRI